MKRIILIAITILAVASFARATQPVINAAAGRISNVKKYEFKATMQGPVNASYVNGVTYIGPKDATNYGIERGTWHATDIDGLMQHVDQEYICSGQSTGTWGDLGMNSQAIDNVPGRMFLTSINNLTVDSGPVMMLSDSVADITLDNAVMRANWTAGFNLNLRSYNGAGGALELTSHMTFDFGDFYDLACMVGGYNTDLEPYYIGATLADYSSGFTCYWRGNTTGDDWKLGFRFKYPAQITPLYFINAHGEESSEQRFIYFSHGTYPAVWQPTGLDLFTDSNDTDLDAHAMNIDPGAGWVELSGDWTIQDNKASVTGSGLAIFETALSDIFVSATVTLDGETDEEGVIFRYQDNASGGNYWFVQTEPGVAGDDFTLYERVNGSDTSRGAYDFDVGTSGTSQIVVRADGQKITCWASRDGAGARALIQYDSGAQFQTETGMGFINGGASGARGFDTFSVHPIESTLIDDTITQVSGGVYE